MKKLLGILVLVFILIGPSYATEKNTVTIDTTKVKELFKNLAGKTLKKDDTIKFLNEYAITIKDERGNGVVTYIFDEENYKRYKDFKVISEDAWRFTKTGQLRLFNTDIKLTWKIKLGKENTINIKAKFDPLGKHYPFTYELKADYLAKVEDFYNKEIELKEREKQKKLEAQQKTAEEKKRLEEEILEAQQKAEEEKKKAEEEKKKAEEEKKKAEEEKKKAEEEKLEAQQKAEEEKKKAEEEKKRLEEEKLKLQKEIEEQKKILEEERKKLEQEKLYIELEPQFRKKCEKKIMNDLYEVGTPEYKECILNKGPEKQQQKQQKKIDDQQTTDEDKKKLEEEKLKLQKEIEEQKKILEEERKKLEQEKKKLTENEVTPKGSFEEKVINLLSAPAINYSDIKFSINKKDFTIFNFEVDGNIVEKIEIEGLNSKYVDCIIEASCDHKYKGKVFNKIKISGINNFELDGGTIVSGEEVGISNLDFKKFDNFKKLIRSNNIPKQDSNLISYIMSLSFNDFYLKNISVDDQTSKYKYEYYLISKYKELGIDKMLIKNMDGDDGMAQVFVEELIIEKFILDNTAILEFLNSENFDLSIFSMSDDDLSYLINVFNSLKKFEINNFTMIDGGKKVFDVNNIQLNNIKFDYFGNFKEKKIPVNFELNIDALDFRLSELDQEFKKIAEDLNYDAIKFDFKGKWDWDTNRNDLLIDLDLGITEAASIKINTSFIDLSTDVLNLPIGPPLGVYLMSTPKFKNFNLTIKDNSLKNRLINIGAGKQGMTSQQYKEFLTQSLNIFVATFATNNKLVERMSQALTNFINKSNKITLSARPFKPLSITDLIPYFKEADFEKIITTLNLKIAN